VVPKGTNVVTFNDALVTVELEKGCAEVLVPLWAKDLYEHIVRVRQGSVKEEQVRGFEFTQVAGVLKNFGLESKTMKFVAACAVTAGFRSLGTKARIGVVVAAAALGVMMSENMSKEEQSAALCGLFSPEVIAGIGITFSMSKLFELKDKEAVGSFENVVYDTLMKVALPVLMIQGAKKGLQFMRVAQMAKVIAGLIRPHSFESEHSVFARQDKQLLLFHRKLSKAEEQAAKLMQYRRVQTIQVVDAARKAYESGIQDAKLLQGVFGSKEEADDAEVPTLKPPLWAVTAILASKDKDSVGGRLIRPIKEQGRAMEVWTGPMGPKDRLGDPVKMLTGDPKKLVPPEAKVKQATSVEDEQTTGAFHSVWAYFETVKAMFERTPWMQTVARFMISIGAGGLIAYASRRAPLGWGASRSFTCALEMMDKDSRMRDAIDVMTAAGLGWMATFVFSELKSLPQSKLWWGIAERTSGMLLGFGMFNCLLPEENSGWCKRTRSSVVAYWRKASTLSHFPQVCRTAEAFAHLDMEVDDDNCIINPDWERVEEALGGDADPAYKEVWAQHLRRHKQTSKAQATVKAFVVATAAFLGVWTAVKWSGVPNGLSNIKVPKLKEAARALDEKEQRILAACMDQGVCLMYQLGKCNRKACRFKHTDVEIPDAEALDYPDDPDVMIRGGRAGSKNQKRKARRKRQPVFADWQDEWDHEYECLYISVDLLKLILQQVAENGHVSEEEVEAVLSEATPVVVNQSNIVRLFSDKACSKFHKSATLLNEEFALTCWHGQKTCFFKFGPEVHKASLRKVPDHDDLAVFKVPVGLKVSRVSYRAIGKKDDKGYICFQAADGSLEILQGDVRPGFLHTCNTEVGFSGAGLFSRRDGNLIGVHMGFNRAEGVNYFEPVTNDLIGFLRLKA
jgi:hypothetical protein